MEPVRDMVMAESPLHNFPFGHLHERETVVVVADERETIKLLSSREREIHKMWSLHS